MSDKDLAEAKANIHRMLDYHRLAYEKAIASYVERLAMLRGLEPPSPLYLPWEDARRVAAMVPLVAEVEAWESGEQPEAGRQIQGPEIASFLPLDGIDA